MGESKPIKFRGRLFDSQAVLAKRYSVTPQNFGKRLKSGWTLEQALYLVPAPQRKATRCESVVFRGTTFTSLKSLADFYEVCLVNFYARRSNGWSMEEALGLKDRPVFEDKGNSQEVVVQTMHGEKTYGSLGLKDRPDVEAKGNSKEVVVQTMHGEKTYGSFKKACKEYRVDYKTACARKSHGWTVEQALEIVPLESHSYIGIGVIYLITHISQNKFYVGQTMQRLEVRWRGHLSSATKNSRQLIGRAINQFGASDFKIEILSPANTKNELNQLERKWIKKLRTLVPFGYNAAKGGGCGSPKGIPVCVSGVTYRSIAEAARTLGIPAPVVLKRREKGWSLERSLTTPNHINRNPVTFSGKTYVSMAELARQHGMTPQRLHELVHRRGMTIKQAVDLVALNAHGVCVSVCVSGVTYRSITEAAGTLGIPASAVFARREKGWSLERSLTTPNLCNRKPVTFSGKTYVSMAEFARQHGMTPARLQGLVHRRGMTIKQAVAHNARYKKQNAIRDR